MTDLTDERLLELAHTTGLLAGIRLAAACHPDRIPMGESTAPANAALLRFARAVLAEECAMTTDWKALCAELLADYEQNRFRVELAAEARAVLARWGRPL
jgi:hypothetical protein